MPVVWEKGNGKEDTMYFRECIRGTTTFVLSITVVLKLSRGDVDSLLLAIPALILVNIGMLKKILRNT